MMHEGTSAGAIDWLRRYGSKPTECIRVRRGVPGNHVGRQIGEPVLGNSGDRVNHRLHVTVVVDGGIGDLDNGQDVGGTGESVLARPEPARAAIAHTRGALETGAREPAILRGDTPARRVTRER